MTAAPAPLSCARASGRTFEGPHPKRPSEGFSCCGIRSRERLAAWGIGLVGVMAGYLTILPRGLAMREGPRRAAVCLVAPRW